MVRIWIPLATIVKFAALVLKNMASNRFHDKAHDNLHELYEVICTLSVTRAQCELKIIKIRLRNSHKLK